MKQILISFIVLILFGSSSIQNIKINQFDARNQLKNVIKANETSITFQYDEVGNRIGMIVTNNQSNKLSDKITIVGIKLYPNPTSECFCISGFEDIASLRLTDIRGKVILVKQIQSQEVISIGSLPAGLYIIKLITTGAVIEKKLLKI